MVPRSQFGIGAALLLSAQMLSTAHAAMLTDPGAPGDFLSSSVQTSPPNASSVTPMFDAAADIDVQDTWTAKFSGTSGGEVVPPAQVDFLARYGGLNGGFTFASRLDASDSNADNSPVPLPAAFWLFGSGAIGLLSLVRRQPAALRSTTLGGLT